MASSRRRRSHLARLRRPRPSRSSALVAIGWVFSREQRETSDFFLARRRIPWWAACLSFLATEISAVTIISVPATAYSENWEYAQFFIGSSLAKFAVALLFIPAFYRYDVHDHLRVPRAPLRRREPGDRLHLLLRHAAARLRRAADGGVRWPCPCSWAGRSLPTIALFTARVDRLHRARRREGGGVDQRLPGDSCSSWAGAATVAFLACADRRRARRDVRDRRRRRDG